MQTDLLWSHEDPIRELLNAPEIPDWIDPDISPSTVAAICQGGCASGAYMPAVTYYDARQTMGEHGDDVLGYIEGTLGELPQPDPRESWSGLACFYLSYAVELWASSVEKELAEILESCHA